MTGIREIVTVIASTGVLAGLLTAFFDWRARLLDQLRGDSHEH